MAGRTQLAISAQVDGGDNQHFANTQLHKWGTAAKAGFQVVPNVLLRAQSHLGIDSIDVVILLNLSLHWWGSQKLPFPSPGMIADRMSTSRRTIERRLSILQEKGFIRRLPPQSIAEGKPKVRKFEMDGLVKKLEAVANQGLAQRSFSKRQLERSTKIAG